VIREIITVVFETVYTSQSRVAGHSTKISTVMSALAFAICFTTSGLV
jgi:hypothetical protein